MSAGPIAQERAAHRVPAASTSKTDRRCARGEPGRGYCGRRCRTPEIKWSTVTCVDCVAARRADEQAGKTKT